MISSPGQLLWADFHNHNEIGYGRGSIERSYRIAENTLDAYALSVHGHWPDPPADDRELAQQHLEAFARSRAAFPEVIRQANAHYRPGHFVCFSAYEWHSTRWGDYVILFPSETAELFPAGDLPALQSWVRQRGALMIPHHVGYRCGWRGLDWSQLDEALSPVVEIFSEHGGCWEYGDLFPLQAHSMGGLTASQTMAAQLARGAHFGFTAGTDTHVGYPGTFGEGLTGLFAQERTRESVFDALRRRHTLATTGERIALWVESNDAMAGDVLAAGAPRVFRFQVDPLAPLDYVEVIKNGARAQVWNATMSVGSPAQLPEAHLLRLEWGWGQLGRAAATDWQIRLAIEEGVIDRVVPCFCGGPDVTKENRLRRIDERTWEFGSFSSRGNALPTQAVVARVLGTPATKLRCEAETLSDGKPGGCRLSTTLDELRRDDAWGAILPRFSSPKLRIGRAWKASELALEGSYRDERPGSRDTYVFKARQKNGHTVWASPLLFTA